MKWLKDSMGEMKYFAFNAGEKSVRTFYKLIFFGIIATNVVGLLSTLLGIVLAVMGLTKITLIIAFPITFIVLVLLIVALQAQDKNK